MRFYLIIITIGLYLAFSSEALASQIIIPKIGLKDQVGMVLDAGPQWQWSSRPGENRSVWIAGHRTTHTHPFRDLQKLQPGDRIYVKSNRKVYRYIVIRTKVISADYKYRQRLGDRLILTACSKADGTPTSAYYRLAVFAKLDG